MRLTKIEFVAYKSLVNKELLITHDCMGFVGTNESGKSNVLSAINILGGGKKLSILDTPKMNLELSPRLEFKFVLKENERTNYKSLIYDWGKEQPNLSQIDFTDIEITYVIVFNKKEGLEERFFYVNGYKLNKEYQILRFDETNDIYKIKIGNSFDPISKHIIVSTTEILDNEKLNEIYKSIDSTNANIVMEETNMEHLAVLMQTLNAEINHINASIAVYVLPGDIQKKTTDTKQLAEKKRALSNIKSELIRKNSILSVWRKRKSEYQAKIEGFDIASIIKNLEEKGVEHDSTKQKNKELLVITQNEIDVLEKDEDKDDDLIDELAGKKKLIKEIQLNILSQDLLNKSNNRKIEYLSQSITEKYTTDISEINKYLEGISIPFFTHLIPKVVFWENSKNYILQSETQFSEILSKTSLSEISRPLLNIFRIGLNIKTIEELYGKLKQIQEHANERSRLQNAINIKINSFIKGVWENYDQELKITLEKEQIRIEIYDPKRQDASYYNMDERSQGAQTFLSFLLTIGAEAEHGVISNTILLLDEPETHLHPSGVRFMLQELIKISEKNNLVLYATHSIFLIDRNNFNRHVILLKEKEHTVIKPSNIGRIGYFMQEEVLYNTLDLNLKSDLSNSNFCNFVFEGDGDASLFEHFFTKILKIEKRPFPIQHVSFYQGGKCSDIKKYFSQRPIQLGTKWIFILDNDEPANELRIFLEGKYKNYIDSDIFIYQYNLDNVVGNIELEDLFSSDFMVDIYLKTAQELLYTVDALTIGKMIKESIIFNKYNERILTEYVPNALKENFKAAFKNLLNNKIREYCRINDKGEDFNLIFPLYTVWASLILSILSSHQKLHNNYHGKNATTKSIANVAN